MRELRIVNMQIKIPTGDMYFDVRYYDKEEERKFHSNYPNKEDIEYVVVNQAKIPAEELLTYMLFVEKDSRAGYRTFQQIQEKIHIPMLSLHEHFRFDNGKMQGKTIQKHNRFKEEFGVGFSLSTMALIHDNLHEADWEPIPEVNKSKVLDFKIASDGKYIIFVECKGTSNENNEIKTGSSASDQKKHIIGKKEDLTPPENKKFLAYGTIAVLDNREDSIPVVWLVDPPAPTLELSPRKYRLLARLNFYLSNMREISSRITLVTVLTNRLKSLFKTDEYEKLNGELLRSGKGEPIAFSESSFSNKSIVKDANYSNGSFEKAVGRVYPTDQGKKLLFIGLRREVFDIVAKQDFDEILDLRFPNAIESEKVICRFSKRVFQSLDENSYLKQNAKAKPNGYYSLELDFNLVYARSGRVYGVWEEGVDQSKGFRPVVYV